MTITELNKQNKQKADSHKLSVDLAYAVLKIDSYILKRLSIEDMRLLILMFHPTRGLAQLSSSEINRRYDECATAESIILNNI